MLGRRRDNQYLLFHRITAKTAIILIVLSIMTNLACASLITWNTDNDWNGGTHHETQNVADNLILNQTLGLYADSGYYISNTTSSTDPVNNIVPIWYSNEPNENVNVTIELSVDGGLNWCTAINDTEMNSSVCSTAGFGTGQEIAFRANLSTNDTAMTPQLNSINLDYTELVPYLELSLIIPYDNTIIGQNKTFVVNATIYCRDGNCGDVNGTVRYNLSTALPDEAISTAAGDTPFYVTDGANTKNCSTNSLLRDEYCNLSWTINATGDLLQQYEIDVLLESNKTSSNDTGDSTVEIGKILIIGLEFSEINFGTLDPGSLNQPADSNADGYNITVDTNSNDVENLWIKGTNLTHDNSEYLDCLLREQYNPYDGNTTSYPCMINVTNVMWSLESDPAPGAKYNLSGDYERVNKDMHIIPSGGKETSYYWINVPYGIYAGPFTGTITFMVNDTW